MVVSSIVAYPIVEHLVARGFKLVEIKQYRTAAEIVVLILFMASIGVNISNLDQGFIPYSCDKDTVPDMMCYKLSRVNADGIQRNCYYDRDNSRKHKQCSTGWNRLVNLEEYEGMCPGDDTPYNLCNSCCDSLECEPTPECEVCAEVEECEPEIEYVSTDCGSCSGGGTCTPPPVEECIDVELDCDDVNVVSYIDNCEGPGVIKYFCDGVGYDANCWEDGTLEMPFG